MSRYLSLVFAATIVLEYSPLAGSQSPFVPMDMYAKNSSDDMDPGVLRMLERLMKVQGVLRKSVMSMILRLDGKWASDYTDFQDLHEQIKKIGDAIGGLKIRVAFSQNSTHNETTGGSDTTGGSKTTTALGQIGGLVKSLEVLKTQFASLFEHIQHRFETPTTTSTSTTKPYSCAKTDTTNVQTTHTTTKTTNKTPTMESTHDVSPPAIVHQTTLSKLISKLVSSIATKATDTTTKQTKVCSIVCPAETKLVCGNDGKTYNNLCELEMDVCLHDIMTSMLKPLINGPCDDKCDADFVRIGRNCYYFEYPKGSRNVIAAEDDCVARKSRLVAIETQEEFDGLRKMALIIMAADQAGGKNFWTSGRGVGNKTESMWVWSTTGERMNLPDAWLGPQPNGRLTCAAMYAYVTYMLMDMSCTDLQEEYGWICERVFENH